MAGHSKFKKIMHKKGALDSKKALVFTKMMRIINVAIKIGGSDPENNYKLRSAIMKAKEMGVPKDKIDASLKKYSSEEDNNNYEESRYECYGPNGIALIIDALTDNRNRTAGFVRVSISKFGGSMATTGAVSHMFKQLGIIKIKNSSFEELFEFCTNLNIIDCYEENEEYIMESDVVELHINTEELENKGFEVIGSSIEWIPESIVTISSKESAKKILKLIELLEENDDIEKVSSNIEIDENIQKELEDE